MARSSRTIRDLNDRFRKGDSTVPGRIMVTAGIQDLVASHPLEDVASVLARVRQFESFDEDNDPHGEHDFGSLECLGEKLFWKIDYYGPDLMSGSEVPADPEQTVRVLMIMLAQDY